MNVRKIALILMNEYEEMQKYANLSLNSHLTDSLSQDEHSFLTALFYTAVEHKVTYDYYICSISGRGLDKISMNTRNILRLGLAQICDMEKIPDFAAVNETVNLASHKGEKSFVNGVLRAALRNKENLPLPDKNKNTARYLSVKYSFSQSIVKKLLSIFDEKETEELLESFSKIPPTDLTVNTVKISTEEFINKLHEKGFNVRKQEYSEYGVRVLSSIDPRGLDGFCNGEFFVQDAASLAAVSALSLKSGENVVDVCAAPGGKSFAAAVIMRNTGKIYSFDVHESKISLIADGAKRLGIDIIEAKERDARFPDENLKYAADAVICDAPCSGLGVLAKKPDIRYKDLDGTESLPNLQYEILERSSEYVKEGGRILYSTCTLNPSENAEVVEKFLNNHKDFRARDFKVGMLSSEDGKLTLYPHVHGTDGFFISLMERIKT